MPKQIKAPDVQPTTPEERIQLTDEQKARLKAQSGMAAGGIRLPVLNRISLNGNCDAVEDEKGNLVRPPVTYRMMMMKTAEKDVRPENVDLGSPIEVIFVKIRRRLIARDSKGFQTMSSTQHSHKDQVVTLWENGKCIATGKASDLREKYDGLRTIQEIYAIYKGELVMLIVKGAALGSETRDAKLPSFYKFLQSISADGIFSHTTILGGVKEKGAKEFYTMTFEKGRPTNTAEQLAVLEHSDELTALIEQYDKDNSQIKDRAVEEKANTDAEYDKWKGKGEVADNYPTEEIDLAKLPF
jgi:hypothetical protein